MNTTDFITDSPSKDTSAQWQLDHREALRCWQTSPLTELESEELLALILRTGGRRIGSPLQQARQLLHSLGSLKAIKQAGLRELSSLPGFDRPRALAVQAALELGQRFQQRPPPPATSLHCSRLVYEAVFPHFDGLEQEAFRVLLLNQRNHLLRQQQIALGTVHRCLVSTQDVFAPVLREKATGLILAHNHPSGDPEPSDEDRQLTQRLQQAAKLLGIRLLDHIVVGHGCYVSFADRGWM